MQSKAATVAEYLAELSAERREILEFVLSHLRPALPPGLEEGMQYGMIGYYVPHSRYPAGYHCDPKQPLPCMGLANQKGHLSLYMMGIYMDPTVRERFEAEYKATGKKLDMGKSCVRFKKAGDLALDVVVKFVSELTVEWYIERYERVLHRK